MTKEKTVYYLNHYAINDSLKRGEYFASEFKKLGVNFILVGANNHHQKNIEGNQKDLFAEETSPYRHILVKTRSYGGNGLKRLLNMFEYALAFYRKDFIEELGLERPDTFIVSSGHMFHFHAIRKMAQKYNCKLIFEVRDIWPLSLIELLNTSSLNPIILLMSLMEKYAYRTSDYVVSLLPNSYIHFEEKGMPSKIFRYIPNGYIFDHAEVSVDHSNEYLQKMKSYKNNGYFVVIYTGALGIPNNMLNLLIAMKGLEKEKVCLFIFGNGSEKKSLQDYKNENDLKNVEICNFVEKKLIPSLISEADLTYASVKDKQIYKYGLSLNKFFEYMALSKPVLAAINSPGNVIEKSGGGIVVSPENIEGIEKELRSFSKKTSAELLDMGMRGYEYCKEQHSYEKLAKDYYKILF